MDRFCRLEGAEGFIKVRQRHNTAPVVHGFTAAFCNVVMRAEDYYLFVIYFMSNDDLC